MFYGGDGTIHSTTYVDVETHKGKVVAVWFRCSQLPFLQTEVDADRAAEMYHQHLLPIDGIVFGENNG